MTTSNKPRYRVLAWRQPNEDGVFRLLAECPLRPADVDVWCCYLQEPTCLRCGVIARLFQ